MSEGEIIMGVIHAGVVFLAWGNWFLDAVVINRMGRGKQAYFVSVALPLACGVALIIALQTLAASDVRSTIYVAWYALMGAAWLGGFSAWVLPVVGLSWRDDVLERGNPAAMITIIGAFIGLTAAFAGGNFGDGPGWWVVVLCAALGMGGVVAVWVVAAAFSPLWDRITIDRDQAAGWRSAGLLVAAGIVLGRAVAGDWVSTEETFADYAAIGWVVLPAALAEAVMTRLIGPPYRTGTGTGIGGVLPAFLYVALASWYVVEIGPW